MQIQRPPLATASDLEAALAHVTASPRDLAPVELILCRPDVAERELVDHADLDTAIGLVGDNWFVRGNTRMPDGAADPEAQVTLMNARAAAAVAGDAARWALAGDQLYADFDLSHDNLPPGTHLAIGTALLEVSAKPHNGCAKFTQRFGLEAMRWVNSPTGQHLRLRGVNLRIVRSGTIRVGDPIVKQ